MRGEAPLELVFEAASDPAAAVRGGLSDELRERYAGDLSFALRPDRPTVVANFVETIDGVVSMDREGETGGGEVSGFSSTDRFTMGVLRALADVVLVGAGTIRPSKAGPLTPAQVHPPGADAYARLRRSLGLASYPVTLIATSSGDLDPNHPVFGRPDIPVAVAAAGPALERLRRARLPGHVAIADATAPDGSARGLLDVAARLGGRLVVTEGGPHLFGSLVREGLVDELFLTVSPQLAGRDRFAERLSLIENAPLWPAHPRWARLRSIRRAGDHLFLRYAFEENPS